MTKYLLRSYSYFQEKITSLLSKVVITRNVYFAFIINSVKYRKTEANEFM